jgi:hypothetical protein
VLLASEAKTAQTANRLTPADHDVIQTVRLWTFTPATKDGLPISSRQELHFHFRSARDG